MSRPSSKTVTSSSKTSRASSKTVTSSSKTSRASSKIVTSSSKTVTSSSKNSRPSSKNSRPSSKNSRPSLTSANPRLLRHGESCDYMLSSFKHRNKNKIKKKHLIIMKSSLIYHLKQISRQSMHKWKTFRTCKFTPKVSGLKYF